MAIYHLHIKNISRGDGKSAVAAAAYRSGQRLWNKYENRWTDFTNRQVIVHTEILAPENAPLWVMDREQLWNAVEAAERRKDARLCKEVEVALPVELSRDKQIELVRAFARRFVGMGVIVDIAVHDDNDGNPHCHMLLNMRPLEGEGFGKKMRQLDSKKFLNATRRAWADMVNGALEHAGVATSVDHRTLKAQGIKRPPQVHQGPIVREMVARGAQPTSKVVRYRDEHGNEREVDYRKIDQGKNRVERSQEVQAMTREYDELIGVQRQVEDLRGREPEGQEEARAQDHYLIELHSKREHLLTRVDRVEIERGFGMGEDAQRELLEAWDRENRPVPDRDGRPIAPKQQTREDREAIEARDRSDGEADEARYVRPPAPAKDKSRPRPERSSRSGRGSERAQLDRDIEKIRTNRFLNDDQKTERLRPLMERSVDLMREEHARGERPALQADRSRGARSEEQARARSQAGEWRDEERPSPQEVRDREDRDFDELEREYERSRGVDEDWGEDRERDRDRDDDPRR